MKADQLELTSACFSSFRVMAPLWSVSTVWNHWKASGLTPGGTLAGQEKRREMVTWVTYWGMMAVE